MITDKTVQLELLHAMIARTELTNYASLVFQVN